MLISRAKTPRVMPCLRRPLRWTLLCGALCPNASGVIINGRKSLRRIFRTPKLSYYQLI